MREEMRRGLGAVGMALLLAGCTSPAPAAQTSLPTAAVSPVAPSPSPAGAVPAKPASVPSPSPASAALTPTAATRVLRVGNTDGEGVYIRSSPAMGDRIRAYPDNTELRVIGPDQEGEGRRWYHVRAPDGTEGYVPSEYAVPAE